MQKSPLYVFFHIPKCAGMTFVHHLRYGTKKNQQLEAYTGDTNSIPFFKSQKEVEEYFKSLSQEARVRVRVICGHHAYHGVHELFERPVRYITFLRDPVSRLVSQYNFKVWEFQNQIPRLDSADGPITSVDGKLLSLEEWICRRPDMQDQMVRSLNGPFLKEKVKKSLFHAPDQYLKNAKEALEQFYFVGLVNRYRNDAGFLYSKLGVERAYPDQNISPKYFAFNNQNRHLKKLIFEKCLLDAELYEYAVELNRKRRKELREYWPVVVLSRTRRVYQLPIFYLWFFLRRGIRYFLTHCKLMSDADSLSDIFSSWPSQFFKKPCR